MSVPPPYPCTAPEEVKDLATTPSNTTSPQLSHFSLRVAPPPYDQKWLCDHPAVSTVSTPYAVTAKSHTRSLAKAMGLTFSSNTPFIELANQLEFRTDIPDEAIFACTFSEKRKILYDHSPETDRFTYGRFIRVDDINDSFWRFLTGGSSYDHVSQGSAVFFLALAKNYGIDETIKAIESLDTVKGFRLADQARRIRLGKTQLPMYTVPLPGSSLKTTAFKKSEILQIRQYLLENKVPIIELDYKGIKHVISLSHSMTPEELAIKLEGVADQLVIQCSQKQYQAFLNDDEVKAFGELIDPLAPSVRHDNDEEEVISINSVLEGKAWGTTLVLSVFACNFGWDQTLEALSELSANRRFKSLQIRQKIALLQKTKDGQLTQRLSIGLELNTYDIKELLATLSKKTSLTA